MKKATNSNIAKVAKATSAKTAKTATAKNTPQASSQTVKSVGATATAKAVSMAVVIPKKFGFEETPVEDLVTMQSELQRIAEFFNVELKINLQHPFAVQMGEYNHSDRIYGKISLGTRNDDGKVVAPFSNAAGQDVWSIILNPKHFNRPTSMIAETILHELVHAKNAESGLKDVTGGGVGRHNKHFKAAAEKYGLVVLGEDKTYGFNQTDLAPTTLVKVLNVLKIDAAAFTLVANSITRAPAKKVQSQVKFECGICEGKARAIPTMKLYCNCSGTPTKMEVAS